MEKTELFSGKMAGRITLLLAILSAPSLAYGQIKLPQISTTTVRIPNLPPASLPLTTLPLTTLPLTTTPPTISIPAGSGPSSFTPQIVVGVCVAVVDYSDDCINGDMNSSLRTFAEFYVQKMITQYATVLSTKYLRVRFPSYVQLAEQRNFIFKLERQIIAHTVAIMKADVARLQPFEHETAAQKEHKLAIISNANSYIETLKSKSISDTNNISNYTHNSSTNTTTYRRSPDLQKSWECAGAGNKPGCNWDGNRGGTLMSR